METKPELQKCEFQRKRRIIRWSKQPLTKEISDDPGHPYHEYGDDWPEHQSYQNMLTMKIRFWRQDGNEARAWEAVRELSDFWESFVN